MRVHTENLTADDTDVLGGTALDNLEAGGQLDFYLLSTQADSLITITGPNSEPLIQSAEIPQETRSIKVGEDLSLSVPVLTGGHYTANVDIVTAATVQFMAIYRKAGVDF